MLLRPDARQHQQLRRVDGTAAKDDLPHRMGDAEPAVSAKARADGAAALAQDLLGQSSSDDPEIGALRRRTQIPDGRRAALSVARRRLVIADPVLACTVEIVVAGQAELGCGRDEGL